ncbi:hypothetical protein PLESTB_000172600 [Pleodorina starrii]|uniref:Uncharacterized protein n=1 Tax=Pleodorina starrii TaxID=330485 RepID=A0A9W6BBG5_9CHLO|nr:hypothetical protein PLESTM_000524300 [Pleodorina starrii]GLC49009.1 hypothetical protein PLESTB_000172600 [Pleodorina starrii]GLC66196.1 hypothetical protein PLESTF_000395300 [Pleodorina starrii]
MSANALVEALTQLSQQQQQQQQQQLQQHLLENVERPRAASGTPAHVLEENSGAQLLLQQMLLGEVDGGGASSSQPDELLALDQLVQAGAAPPQSMQQQPTVMQQLASLPTQIVVTQVTDSMQAAGLVNFTFSQSAHSSFVLNTQLDQAGSTSVGILTQALRVVLAARKINQQAVARFDLGFVPFLVTDAAEGIGLLIYKCSLNQDKTRGSVLKVDVTSNPLVAGISLFQMFTTQTQPLEVIFAAEASKVALQALSIMRINLANNGRDVLLLLSTVDYTADASGPKNYFFLKLTPITPPLPCFQHQIEAPKPQASFMTPAGDAAMMAHTQGLAATAAGVSVGALPRHKQMHMHSGPGLGPAAPVMPPGHLPGVMAAVAAGPKPPHGLGPGPLSYGHGAPPGAASALGAAAVAAAAAGGGGGSSKQQRARKADYVIVTEDTAIKNAAGAIAKVLGRVSNQGQCCPVYTEKKTESFTTVISVAVKAVAVARGYVCNEGMGNEVGFQPYLRHLDRRLDLLDLHHYLAPEKKAAATAAAGLLTPGHPHAAHYNQHMGGMMAAAAAKGGAAHSLHHLGGMYGAGGGLMAAAGLAGAAAGGGGGKGHNPLDSFELLDEDALCDERCELAFDVFKVPQLQELHDAGNLPVKVTAHSRPNVVSNIISKLVSERAGAVLITAGGKAMHVAMTAVVSARARLKAKGIDIILLPKFVTVDTTSTLGWESVFLRFTIVRWAPAMQPAAAAPPPQLHPDVMAAAHAGGRYLLPQMG